MHRINKQHLYFLLSLITVAAISSVATYILKPSALSVPFPYIIKPTSDTAYACDAVLGTMLTGDNHDQQIAAMSFTGTDKLAIEVNQETQKLRLLTTASVQSGTATGAEWNITGNTSKILVAEYQDLDLMYEEYNTLIINKDTGIGVWTKSRTGFIHTENPFSQAYYLVCR